jgi:hypothetical protein
MTHSRKPYYWLIIFLIPCIVGLNRCPMTLFLTGEKSGNSPTEPCLEKIQTPTPIQIVLPSSPGPQRTPIIQDGEVVIGPEILPTPTPKPTPSGPVCINPSCSSTPSTPYLCPAGGCVSSCSLCTGYPNLSITACECF